MIPTHQSLFRLELCRIRRGLIRVLSRPEVLQAAAAAILQTMILTHQSLLHLVLHYMCREIIRVLPRPGILRAAAMHPTMILIHLSHLCLVLRRVARTVAQILIKCFPSFRTVLHRQLYTNRGRNFFENVCLQHGPIQASIVVNEAYKL